MIFSFGFFFLSIFFASFIFSAAIFVFPSEYQTGILCPHQICLEIHQGSIFSIQYLNVLIHEDGKNFNSFFLIIFFSDGLLTLLIFAQLLHAITFGLHHVTSIMLVTNLFPDSAKAIGQSSYTVASYGIGGSLGGVFSGLIWEEFFPESIYIFASLVAFLGAVVAWLLIRKYKVECD